MKEGLGRVNWTNAIMGMAVAGIVLLYIAPIPGVLMDILLVASLSFSLLVLFVSLTVEDTAEFTVFPTLLLLATLFRLGLNVSTTRLILSNAAESGQMAAGEIIAGFGSFVAGGNAMVGIVIFSIILVVQFMVITKGADRISEVAARFMLDGLPGKQMGLDQDLARGVITKEEVPQIRKKIVDEANFYASMDGAMKFVRGDAMASLCITLINIIGGLALGVIMYGMSAGQAATIFTTLTIGDGLVSALPALLNAVAAGIIVTRLAGNKLPALEVKEQLLSNQSPLVYSAAVMGILLFTPLPKLPLVMGMMGLLALSWTIHKAEVPERKELEFVRDEEENLEELTQMRPVDIEIGGTLIRLVDDSQVGEWQELVKNIHKKTAEELGIVIPTVNVRGSYNLPPRGYRILIRGELVGQGKIYHNRYLAVNPGRAVARLEGEEVIEPIWGLKACWIGSGERDFAESHGFQVFTPIEVLAFHYRSACLDNVDKILTDQDVRTMVDRARQSSPDLVEETIPHRLKYSRLKAVLQELLREQVPVRDMETILEIGGEHNRLSVMDIAEAVRLRLSGSLVQKLRQPNGQFEAIGFSREAENLMGKYLKTRESQKMETAMVQEIQTKISRYGNLPILCRDKLRRTVSEILRRHNQRVPVLSYQEVDGTANMLIRDHIEGGCLVPADAIHNMAG